ncbi:BON domain-containing protein [Pseudodesulfovibrio sp. JC047]|uniref:BON domain-containing protein n=1 Tax=Pseudodesulfovibrio sp. JC047 TaxID=2683199 RepID=UPI0013D2FE23|nr:BON domain-containing protein [Pseudodesulfovibrio sp. JC047]NDV18616.1 BON domain-containing protein [Pseudodesulfovibrio sp. JC047]
MHRFFPIFILMLTIAFGAVLQGCAVYDVAVEERNASQWADDKSISFVIEKEFLADDMVKYLDFDAYSYEGHVYIIGEYESRAQVDRAVQIAKATEGVKTVTTYVLPKRAHDYCGTTDSLDIYAKLKEKLIRDKDIWSTNIEFEVVQCNVVLVGLLGSSGEISRAIGHAKSVPGVRNVKSFLKVKR